MDNSRTSNKNSVISYVTGNLLHSTCDCLINPVNTVGVMGGGLALQFKETYPEMMDRYVNDCTSGVLIPGKLTFYQTNDNKIVCSFPTKEHYYYPSLIKYVEAGLIDFTKQYSIQNIKSAAFPKLGCGLGGLDWDQVKPLMEMYLSKLPIRIEIYE